MKDTKFYVQQLNQVDEKLAALNYTLALVNWDAQTLAPKNGGKQRAAVMGTMSEIMFRETINATNKECLDYLNAHKDELDETTLAKLRIYTDQYEQISKIPAEEFAAFAALRSESSQAWQEAREKNDFSIFAPFLDKVLKMTKKFVEYRGYEGHPYSTLLNDYEKGLSVEEADKFFKDLKAEIVPLVKKIGEKEVPSFSFTTAAYDVKKQEEVSKYIMEALDFNMDAGVLAISAHPFTSALSREDVRLTTHYHENDVMSSISSTIHETGHGIYEQNITPDYGMSALTTGTSMGIHESQSRIYENNFGRSKSFWIKHLPKLQEMYPEQLKDVDIDTFYHSLNIVQPSLIRIEADEVTYPLHIMVRYEMEKYIMENDFDVYELPKLWNDKYEEYLGIRPKNDAEGILQDVHWSEGLFGYFPSYALGSAYAAQFEHYMRKDIDVDTLLEEGKMAEIREWLSKKIHTYGASKIPSEIIEGATGESFDPSYFTTYLSEKFNKLYNL